MGGSSAPMAYTPANQAGADASYTSTLNNLTAGNQGTYGTAQTGFNNTYNAVANNPYAASAQTGVNTAAAAGYGAGQTSMNNASTSPRSSWNIRFLMVAGGRGWAGPLPVRSIHFLRSVDRNSKT